MTTFPVTLPQLLTISRLPLSTGNVIRPLPDEHLPLHGGAGSVIGRNSILHTGVTLGEKVLIIDLSLHTQKKCSYGISSYCALTLGRTQAVPLLDEDIPAGSLELIPGDEKLLNLEREVAKRMDKELLLGRFIASLVTPHDYVLINCPSSLCIRTINALAIAEEAIIPVKAAEQNSQALPLLFKMVGHLADELFIK